MGVLTGWLRRWLSADVTTDDEPLALAGALIADEEGRLLLIHRATPEVSWWEVPGGKVEAGEAPWDAARRELSEELDVAVELIAKLGTERFDGGDRCLEYTWYVARVNRGQPRLVERERFDQLRYFTFKEFEALAEASPSVRCLRDRLGSALVEALPHGVRPEGTLEQTLT